MLQDSCREAGLQMECGPSDRKTKLPSAGVGMIVQKGITFMKAEKKQTPSRKHMQRGEWRSFSSTWDVNKTVCVLSFMGVQVVARNARSTRRSSGMPSKKR